MPPEFMGQQYPYPVPPGPPMPYPPPPGMMQPPLSAIPRGGSAGPLKNGNETIHGEDPDTREPPNKKRRLSHESPSIEQVPTSRAAVSPLRRDTGPFNGSETTLDASLMLDADEAATVVALLQQASGQAITAFPLVVPTPRPSESQSANAPQAVAPGYTSIHPSTETLDDPDADADGDVDADAEGEAETAGAGEKAIVIRG